MNTDSNTIDSSQGISVVINTFNEEKNIERAIKSVSWADEILVCDMHSDDNTAVIAKKNGAIVFLHKRVGFVEPARNFAISKAAYPWILILDADEEIPASLADKFKEIISHAGVCTFVEVPRKNIIFGKWMRNSMWWPDYHVRFFKRGMVEWSNKIHSKPKTNGQGIKLPLEERWAITHYHYTTVSQFLRRMDRYTDIQAKEMKNEGVEIDWRDLITKPLGEFLSRFFAHRGFEDGMHGLALAFLQAFSHFVMYLKLWELKGFEQKSLNFKEVEELGRKSGEEIDYWFKYGNLSKNPIKRLIQRARNKI